MSDHKKQTPDQQSILVIDDDETIRELLRAILEREGYRVLDAPDGDKGLKQFTETPTDLVITDLIMPGKKASKPSVISAGNSRVSKLSPFPAVAESARIPTSKWPRVSGLCAP